MSSIPRRIIEKSLRTKGFRCDNKRDHRYWYFFYRDQKTIVRTRISTALEYRDYGIDLLSQMKRQLHFDSMDQLKQLLTCSIEEPDYIEILLQKGVI